MKEEKYLRPIRITWIFLMILSFLGAIGAIAGDHQSLRLFGLALIGCVTFFKARLILTDYLELPAKSEWLTSFLFSIALLLALLFVLIALF